MSDILQTNIFFLITSVSVIVISGLVCIFIYQLIKVVNSVLRTAKKLEDGSDLVVKEMRSMRRNLRKNFNLSKLFMFVVNTCLLYTSPSPRDRTRSRMPSSA